jgi:tetratricopeptide (TPR) repeat protein
VAYSRVADIYFKAGRIKDASVWLNKAAPILKAVADASPNDVSALFNLAGITNQRADAEWRLDNGDEGRKLYAEALNIRLKRLPIVQAEVKSGKTREAIEIAARIDIAKSYSFIAFSDLRLGDPDSALKNYIASERDFDALPANWKENPDLQREIPDVLHLRAETQVRLGDVRLRQGKLDDAETHYRAGLLEREKLKSPLAISASRLALGDFFLMGRKDTAAAIVEYQVALRMLNSLLTRFPDNLEFRRFAAAAHYRLGFAADKFDALTPLAGNLGRTVLSLAHFSECLRLRRELATADPADSQAQIDLMLALGRAGRSGDAAKIAARFLANAGDDRRLLFHAACGFAILSNENEPDTANYREQAFRALETLFGRGWKDWVTLELDPDLENIRDDKRFSNLMLRLKSQAKSSN